MPLPWLNLFDIALDLTNLAIGKASRNKAVATELPATASRTSGPLETHLAGVVVAALKEVFDRDSNRLELEREQMERERERAERERERAERALKLEWLRQAGEREIGRLRL